MHQWYWCAPSIVAAVTLGNKGTSLPNAEALISAKRHFEMPMSTSQPYTTPPSFELWRLNSFLFFVQPKFMKRLDRPHNRRSLVLCAWKGTKESSREVGLFLSLSVHNSDAIFLHWGHQPPLVVPLYSWLHVLCATFWRISGFPGPPIASTYCGVKQCNTFYNSYTRIIYALSSRF